MNGKVQRILRERMQDSFKAKDRIFLASKGGPIDEKNFNRRYWQKMCRKASVNERVTYASRHTTGSHALANGQTVAQVAEMLGDTIDTVVKTYLHSLGDIEIPEI